MKNISMCISSKFTFWSHIKHLSTLVIFSIIVFLSTANGKASEPSVVSLDKSFALSKLPISANGAASLKAANRTNSRVATQHILVKISSDLGESKFLDQARGLGLRKLKKLAQTNWYTMALPPNASATAREMATAAKGLAGVISAVADPILHINDTIPPTDPYYADDPDPGADCDILYDPGCTAEDLVDQWGLFKVEAEAAWAISTGSPDVIIAILDSGIDEDHDDLWGNIWTNTAEMNGVDGVDDDGNGKVDDKRGYDFAGNNVGAPDDDQLSEDANPNLFSLPEHQWLADPLAIPFGYRFDGDPAVGDGIDNNLEYYPLFYTIDIGAFHGTAVAGVAAMMANNINPETASGEGFVGACWNCKIMNVRTINAEGEALGSDMVEAIYYAADNGARIINASWGIAPGGATAAELAPLEDAIQYAVNVKGVVFIAASGNGGEAGLYFPASMPETIAVGSSNWLDARSEFSTYAQGSEVLDVVAPGELIWTSGVMSAYDAWAANSWLLFPELWYEPWRPGDDTYVGGDGTSFATPLVSGYVGLILSQNSCATVADVRNILRTNAVDVGTPGYDAETGYGRMRMIVPDLGCDSGDAMPAVTISVPGGPVSGTVGITATASDDNGVMQVEFLVDGGSLGIDSDGTDGWSWSWDSTLVADGSHAITATATDTIGQTASDASSVEVDNISDPPPEPPTELAVTDLINNADGTATISWNDNQAVELQRERLHPKRGVWQSLTNLGSFTDGTYTDDPGAGTYHYRVSADAGVNWSEWSTDIIVTEAGGGGNGGGKGGGGGNGGGKPNK